MKKILVTGGVGFIGTNLIKELQKLDYQIVSLDNYSTGSKKNQIKGVSYINDDINNIDKVFNDFDLNSYIGLLRASVLSSGFIFELPIVIFFLTRIGMVTPNFLQRNRKFAIVIVLSISGETLPVLIFLSSFSVLNSE